jgi:hypothetical protein
VTGYVIATYLRETNQELPMPKWLLTLCLYVGAAATFAAVTWAALVIHRDQLNWKNYFNDFPQ